MGYDWTKSAEGTQADKIPTGIHDLEIVKVRRGPKSGEPFRSSKGDPQLMVIFQDASGCEAAQMYTLSPKAAWTMAMLLGRCGVDLARMKADNIEPMHFANEKFAASKLVGLRCRAAVSYEKGDDGKEYSRVEPMKVEGQERTTVLTPDADPIPERAGLPGSEWGGKGPMSEDSIPF